MSVVDFRGRGSVDVVLVGFLFHSVFTLACFAETGSTRYLLGCVFVSFFFHTGLGRDDGDDNNEAIGEGFFRAV